MTSVLTRWLAPTAQPERPKQAPVAGSGRGLLLAGGVAGLGAAAAGLILLAAMIGLAWIVEPAVAGSILGPARLCAQAWLLGHGADISAPGLVVAVSPLGLSMLFALCCWYAGCWAAKRAQVSSLSDVGTVLATMVLAYTAVGVGLGLLGSTSGVDIEVTSAVLGVLGLSAGAGVGGLLRTAGHGRLAHDVLPFPSRAVLSGAGVGAALVLAAGVGALGIAIMMDRRGFAALTESLAPGWTAGIGLFLLCVLLLPNAALYAVAMLLGPGFTVGSGTTVSAFGVTLGLVPGLPLAAALPDSPVVPLAALVAMTVPLLCGLVMGAVVQRRLDEDLGPLVAAGWAAVAGLVLAAAMGGAQWLAGGSLGDDALATIGARPLATFAAGAAVLGLPAALSAGLLRRRQLLRWRHVLR